ncbi:MAG: hypothetical protein Ta2G_05350 [Termitinemataceae bacterium]|nr:MAG: hypothetical protein Ta2G_05350 [Termitinemataceae bacterium]
MTEKTKKAVNKRSVYAIAAASMIAAFSFASCDGMAEALLGGNSNAAANDAVKGVFITFTAPGSNQALQKINLRQPKKTLQVTFPQGGTEEQFFEYLATLEDYITSLGSNPKPGEAGFVYDYIDDPLSLGKQKTLTENSSSEYKFEVLTDEEGNPLYTYTYSLSAVPTEPVWTTYDFTEWVVQTVTIPAGVTFTGLAVDDVVNAETFQFVSSEELAKATKAVASIKANKLENAALTESSGNLQNKYTEILQSATNPTYPDDYVIGQGGADTTAFQRELDAAIELLAGTLETLTTAIDGEYYLEIIDNGDGTQTIQYLDTDGETPLVKDSDDAYHSALDGKTYNVSELPLPVTVTMEYLVKDPEAMNAQTAKLEQMAAHIDWSTFRPNQVAFGYKEATEDSGQYYALTINSSGTYEIELNGASGGHISTRALKPALGGLGGKLKGTVHFDAGTMLKIFVGGEGQGSGIIQDGNVVLKPFESGKNDSNTVMPAGFPDGGQGGAGRNGERYSSSGGGSSSIRVVSEIYDDSLVGSLKDKNGALLSGFVAYIQTQNQRIAVAGGGGGAAQSGAIEGFGGAENRYWPGLRGGNAGPASIAESTDEPKIAVQNGVRTYTQRVYTSATDDGNKLFYSILRNGDNVPLWYATENFTHGAGGKTATGIGEDASWPNANKYEPTGGGGGGWKGGGSASLQNNLGVGWISSAGGGSNGVDSTVTVTENTVNTVFGNGSVRIKFLTPDAQTEAPIED